MFYNGAYLQFQSERSNGDSLHQSMNQSHADDKEFFNTSGDFVPQQRRIEPIAFPNLSSSNDTSLHLHRVDNQSSEKRSLPSRDVSPSKYTQKLSMRQDRDVLQEVEENNESDDLNQFNDIDDSDI